RYGNQSDQRREEQPVSQLRALPGQHAQLQSLAAGQRQGRDGQQEQRQQPVEEITEHAHKGPQCSHQETSDLSEQDIVAIYRGADADRGKLSAWGTTPSLCSTGSRCFSWY